MAENSSCLISKRKIQEMVAQIDPSERLEPEVEDVRGLSNYSYIFNGTTMEVSSHGIQAICADCILLFLSIAGDV